MLLQDLEESRVSERLSLKEEAEEADWEPGVKTLESCSKNWIGLD